MKDISDNTFENNVDYSSTRSIIETDGLRGFLFVAAKVGELLFADSDIPTDDYFLKLITDKIGVVK